MKCAESEGNVYARKAVSCKNQDYTCCWKKAVYHEGNKDVFRESISVLKEHCKRDQSRQKCEYDTQRIKCITVVKIISVKVVEKVSKLADDYCGDACKAQKENDKELNRDPAFYGCLRVKYQG